MSEAVVAIGAGIGAHSLALIALGAESVIERASASAAYGLWQHETAVLATRIRHRPFASPSISVLAKAKLRVAAQLGSWALRADGVESIACGYLSAIVVIALSAQLILGAWWLASVTSLAA